MSIIDSNIVNLNASVNRFNPFKETFDGSVLDFEVAAYDLFIIPYKDGLSLEGSTMGTKENKAIAKLDSKRNPVQWWPVGIDYPIKSHREFFGRIEEQLLKHMNPNHLNDVDVITKSSRNGRWGLRNYLFNKVNIPITTKTGFSTTMKLRIVAWSGLDGRTANNYLVGAFDGFCSNGCVFTQGTEDDFSKKYRRNTKGFNCLGFSSDIYRAVEVFYKRSAEFQTMAETVLSMHNGTAFITALKTVSDAKKKGLVSLYEVEVQTRGENVFSLHSAFTNYASHQNADRFKTRTGPVNHENMFKREEEIYNIVNLPAWRELVMQGGL